MSGLFLRFYLGILLVLVAAWAVHVFVTPEPTDEENAIIIESAMGGSVRLARQAYEATHVQDRATVLQSLQAQFDFPVQIVPISEIPFRVRVRFSQRDDIALYVVGRSLYLVGRLDDLNEALLFGPLPRLVQPSRGKVMLGLAIVLMVAATAIFVLLRPLMSQLQRLEFAAKSLSLGNLNTRIDGERSGPLVNVATAINQLATQTQSLLTTQQELMQAVSHELKTPLSRIQFAVELLESDTSIDNMRGRVDVMRTAAVEMDEMVNRLLQYVKSDAPRSSAPKWQVPLEPVVNEIFEGERLLNAHLTYELDPKVVVEGISILTNVPDLTCVISNTIRNASRYAKQVIRVSAFRTSKGVIVDIDDDGPGIPEKQRKRVFQPFERLSDERGSAGLGLALVGRILTRHGGWAKAEASPLDGCRIRTFWPRRNR